MIQKLSAYCLFVSLAFTQPRPEPATGNLPAQPLGASDLISLSVYHSPELSRVIRISAEGDIQVPMVKERIPVAGLMPAEVEKKVAMAFTETGLLVDPAVTITIVEYFSRPISVMGAVRRPLTFQANGPLKLLDALSRAEGLSTTSGPEILVSRHESQGELIKRIPIRGLIDEANAELNITLTGGEEIRVPEAGKVFVVGNVRKPGTFAVQDGSGLTVMKALALSEGLMPFAAKQAYIYRREAAGNGKSEIAIELKRLLDRKTPDIALEANDILYIPDNTRKRISMTTLERVISFGSTTASGLLIWGAAR